MAVTGAKTEKDNEINRIYYRILVENPSLSPATNVAVMDELPHTATGKLQKLKLREMFKDHKLPTA